MSAAFKDRDIAARTAGTGHATDARLRDSCQDDQQRGIEKIYARCLPRELSHHKPRRSYLLRVPPNNSQAKMEAAIAMPRHLRTNRDVKDMHGYAELKPATPGHMDSRPRRRLGEVEARLGAVTSSAVGVADSCAKREPKNSIRFRPADRCF